MQDIIAELQERELLEDMTSPDLRKVLSEPVTLYMGVDPTADSLHLGHLVGVVMLERFRRAGHRVISLVGGATALIGDPGGKQKERPLLDRPTVESNARGIQQVMEPLSQADQVNNIDWIGKMDLVGFLRDVGKHFRIGPMLGKEMVRARLASEEGLSFTEFSYSLLQALDYLHLYDERGVTLQIGGSDQWGNITAGIELIRKVRGGQAYGLTFPLLTRSDGKKFGKSESGAVWLSAERTSPYEFYQYLVRTPDGDVTRMMRSLTFLEMEEIRNWERQLADGTAEPHAAQRRLASVLTEWIHGKEGLAAAERVTAGMQPGGEASLDAETLEALAADMESQTLPVGEVVDRPLLDLLVALGMIASKGEGRRLARQGGLRVNHKAVADEGAIVLREELIEGRLLLLGVGKRKKLLLRISPTS